MDVNFELYKTFYFTAKHQSFTKAAEALFVTQSSVSQSIKQLEQKLDKKLFVRHKRRINLTKEGEILFAHVEQAYNHIKVAERKLEHFNQGEINIGASDTICKYFLLPYFKEFHKSNPHIKINITNQPSKKTLEMIQEGLMDFGIVAISPHEQFKDIQLIKLKDYEEILIADDHFANELGLKTSLSKVIDYPLITLRSNTKTRLYLDEAFRKQDLLLEPEFEMVSVDLIIEMVKAGLGVGFVMEDTLTDALLKDINRIEVLPKLPTREIAFAISDALPLSDSANNFINFTKNLI
jgi:DNA-binding transcriptional LysR family regulator